MLVNGIWKSAELSVETRPVARKEHECWGCAKTIRVGEKHRKYVGKSIDLNGFVSMRHCINCVENGG